MQTPINKRKIFNDPVYGFITIRHEVIYDLIEHRYFQRLRRIKQLGMSHFVYPGAYHTRFHHALGALHLMQLAVEELCFKGHEITPEEQEAVCIGILLHDIGHGPFSHALERCLAPGISHEFLSELIMDSLNHEFDGKLTLAIEIFQGKYHKRFLQQLISSQLDMDRLDYLVRDSFYTGVQEGSIGFDRIIKMLEVKNDELVIEAKGIYSVEKFLVARRLMYWQVYLHKTVLCAEQMMVKVLLRAKELAADGAHLFATPSFQYFLYHYVQKEDFESPYTDALEQYLRMDDNDVMASIKQWVYNDDPVLSRLCKGLVERRLYRSELYNEPIDPTYIEALRAKAQAHFKVGESDLDYLVIHGSTSNSAYSMDKGNTINILFKDGTLKDVAEASDQLNIQYLAQPVVKYYVCYPKELV
ncbi:HD domain-containing protein [soil metagenome]